MYIKLTIVFAISILVLGCDKNEVLEKPLMQPKCLPSQSQCQISTAFGNFNILFNQEEIITETPFEIHISSQMQVSDYSVSGYMEGKDMFMGKIPLFFENVERALVAKTILGSCSQERMIWRTWIEIRKNNSDEIVTRFVDFESKRR